MVAKKDQGRDQLNKRRPRGNAGGSPKIDDSAIIKAVGLLLAQDEWKRQRSGNKTPLKQELDPTNAIRQALSASHDTYGDDGNREVQIASAVPRILAKLREADKNGRTVLENAIEHAMQMRSIVGSPVSHTLFTMPPPPAVSVDVALINDFTSAVTKLQVVARDLERQKYGMLDTNLRAEIRSFLTAFKKLGI